MPRPKIANALRQYQSVGVNTGLENATPHRLVQMLMEGALEKIAMAKGQISHQDFAGKSKQISWAISIINGLRGSLDMKTGGEIARNLNELYDYLTRRLFEANLSNDVSVLDEVSSLLLEIKSAWDAIPENVKRLSNLKQISAAG